MADVFIYDALRTPRGRGKAGKGGLSAIHPQELLAQTLNTMAERRNLDKNLVEDVSIGCVTQTSEQGACIARTALIAAQWPEDVTGYTVNRFCGSGLEAVNGIAAKIGAGFLQAGIGGGVESMSRVPMGSDTQFLDAGNEKLRKRFFLVPQGISADLIATREGFSRADVDNYALHSQQKAARATVCRSLIRRLPMPIWAARARSPPIRCAICSGWLTKARSGACSARCWRARAACCSIWSITSLRLGWSRWRCSARRSN